VIRAFAHKGLEKFFLDGIKKGIQAKHAQRLADLLDRLNASRAVKDMNFPGSGLHQLKGKLQGYWSVKVSGNWWVIFQFKDGDAFNVDYVDYH